jgi:hypothetical protein
LELIQLNGENCNCTLNVQIYHHFSPIPIKWEKIKEISPFSQLKQIEYPQIPSSKLLEDLIKMWQRYISIGTPLLKIMPDDCLDTIIDLTQNQIYNQSQTMNQLIMDSFCKVNNYKIF